MTPEELLEQVTDRDSFIAFVTALADEREAAQKMERAEPMRYSLGGAHGWKNGCIASFLHGSLAYFESKPLHEPENVPSWRMFAEFLYVGKIYE